MIKILTHFNYHSQSILSVWHWHGYKKHRTCFLLNLVIYTAIYQLLHVTWRDSRYVLLTGRVPLLYSVMTRWHDVLTGRVLFAVVYCYRTWPSENQKCDNFHILTCVARGSSDIQWLCYHYRVLLFRIGGYKLIRWAFGGRRSINYCLWGRHDLLLIPYWL